MPKQAIIIGAGPAGLTAAYELLQRTDIIPIILEKSGDIGGISKTIRYKGNRMDMGPHRFFSKSDRVMDWWLNMMPLDQQEGTAFTIKYQNKTREIRSGDPAAAARSSKDPDKTMLVIQRLTRIYFLRQFFAYPIQLGIDTLKTLGLIRTFKILCSFLWAKCFPRKPVKTLEDFIINQFGRELYLLFFKDYTEKVWGVPCEEISAEWGSQRIKGVSLSKAIFQAVKSLRKSKKTPSDLGQKGVETSLIEQFLYPKYGPGSLWEEVARQVQEMGGKIYHNQEVHTIEREGEAITFLTTMDKHTGDTRVWEGDYFFSTMPVKELIAGMGDDVPANVQEIAAGLQYRDFINVGILLKQLSAPTREGGSYEKLDLKDNWIYIQERDVKVGRLMIYNNWGTGMIKDPDTVWIGMEYFCNTTDAFWALDDATIQATAIRELEKMGLAQVDDVLDITVQRMEKTYPAYFGTYDRFAEIREYVDKYKNLFLVGRNGMHKYNNADHSMLTAMVSVDNIGAGILTKENIWAINTEQEYHEEKTTAEAARDIPAGDPADQRRARVPEQYAAPSWVDYVWRNKRNRAYWLFSLSAFLVQFILFKFRYPYANYMPDSYSYLETAYNNVDVNMWPVAYSKFLRLISVFTHSDKIVVGFQYLFLQGAGLVFLSTLLHFLRPGKTVRNVLLVFFLFNPIPLYVANYISADSLFIGFSLLWLSSLWWIIYQPRPWQLVVQALLLLACFTLRYNAIYYPLITALAFILSRQHWGWKAGGIALGAILVIASIGYTSQKMKDVTGTRQFSAFGGWQLANNALYMYEHIPAADRGPIPPRFARLETMVRQHMDTLSKVKYTKEDSVNSYFYLWSGKGPLIQYLSREWKKDSTTPYFKRWAAEGPLYANYAMYLIRKFPLQFAEDFLLPNAVKYAVPPNEFLSVYNMGSDSVGLVAKNWFNYKSQKVSNQKKGAAPGSFFYYNIFAALINVCFIFCSIGFLVFGGLKKADPVFSRILLLVTLFGLANGAFSIFASPIVLRYQVFPIMLCFVVSLFLLEFLLQENKASILRRPLLNENRASIRKHPQTANDNNS